MKRERPGRRSVVNHLQVVVSEGERAKIKARARAARLSVSAYLRAAGLGHPIKSVLDQEAIGALARVNADLARLGNLFKWGLEEAAASSSDVAETRRLLGQIGQLQDKLAEIASRV